MTTNQDFTQSSGGNNGKSNRFYNSIGATGVDLKKFQRQAETQEEKILTLLEQHPQEEFTKHEIKTQLVNMGKIHDRTPESSISRALTDLMNDGKIMKLDKMRMGEFDKPNHLWKLKITLTAGTQAEIF
jgi:hypothetical protein